VFPFLFSLVGNGVDLIFFNENFLFSLSPLHLWDRLGDSNSCFLLMAHSTRPLFLFLIHLSVLASGKTKQLREYLCGMLQWLFLNWWGKVFVGIVGRLGVVVIGMGNEYSIDIGTYIGIYIDIQST